MKGAAPSTAQKPKPIRAGGASAASLRSNSASAVVMNPAGAPPTAAPPQAKQR